MKKTTKDLVVIFNFHIFAVPNNDILVNNLKL